MQSHSNDRVQLEPALHATARPIHVLQLMPMRVHVHGCPMHSVLSMGHPPLPLANPPVHVQASTYSHHEWRQGEPFLPQASHCLLDLSRSMHVVPLCDVSCSVHVVPGC